MQTAIANRDTVTEMVARYNRAIEAMKELNTAYEAAQKVLEENGFRYHYMNFDRNNSYEESLKAAKIHTWFEIIRKTGIQEVMTCERQNQLDEEINQNRMPEITVENVLAILEQLYNRTPELMEEFCKSCYELFIPRAYSKLKTSRDGEIKQRGILTGVFSNAYGFRFSYYGSEHKLKTLENAFSLLDGKGIVTDNKPSLYSLVGAALASQETQLETEYFKLKWFTNGNLHVEFKRMDLVARLNQIGGANRLKTNAA